MSFEVESSDYELAPQPGPQTILLACDAQEIFFGGALGAGKSYALGLALVDQHQKYGKNVSAIVFRETVPELADLIKKFKEILEPFGWEYFEGKKTFKHPDGAECKMRHCETDKDVKKYWGHEYSLMLVDEMGNMGEKTLEAIQKLRAGRLRSAAGVPVKFIATANPCGSGHKFCKERYIDPAPPFVAHKDPRSKHNIIFIPGRMEDNIAMLMNDPDYRERCKSMGPEWYVDALINGDWTKSPEGNLFHREWFNKRYDPTNLPKFDFIAASWDTAFKTTKDSARSAVTVWGYTANANSFYLLYGFAAKLEFPQLEKKARDVHIAYSCNNNWIEDKASGQSLIQTLKDPDKIAEGLVPVPFKAISVDGDKLRRAFAVTPYFESGKILVPNSAPWLNEYIDELCSFPAPTGFADYVDSTSQAITELVALQKRLKFFSSSNVVPLNASIFSR